MNLSSSDPAVQAMLSGLSADRQREARRNQARKARQEGADWEKKLGDMAAAVAVLHQLPTGAKRAGDQWIPQKMPYDFAGCLRGSGIGIFFDAKSIGQQTKVKGLDARNEDFVKPQQAAALYHLSTGGAYAGLLVRAGPIGRVLWLDGAHLWLPKMFVWRDPAWLDLGHVDSRELFRTLIARMNAGGKAHVHIQPTTA